MKRALLAIASLGLLPGATTLGDEQQSLARARMEAAAALARSREMERGAAGALDAAQQARLASVAVAARIQSAEADMAAAEARIRIVARLQSAQRARLAARQGSTIGLVAALQTLALRPPGVALVQPGSTDDLVHVRALLAGVMPIVRARTAGLRAEVSRARNLRVAADRAAALLRLGRERLESDRMELARVEAAWRARSRRFADSAMFETDRAVALGEEARDISALLGEVEAQAALGARLASLPGPLLRPDPGQATIFSDSPTRYERAPPYRLPVIGRVVAGLGEMSDDGVRARGLTLATSPGAIVVAPTRGRIAFAGPYRGYGRIAIVDHGDGWTTLLTGLAALSVKVGDQVEQGSPLGRAAERRPRVTVELRRAGQPVDITSLVS